jgi:hypothetical protein
VIRGGGRQAPASDHISGRTERLPRFPARKPDRTADGLRPPRNEADRHCETPPNATQQAERTEAERPQRTPNQIASLPGHHHALTEPRAEAEGATPRSRRLCIGVRLPPHPPVVHTDHRLTHPPQESHEARAHGGAVRRTIAEPPAGTAPARGPARDPRTEGGANRGRGETLTGSTGERTGSADVGPEEPVQLGLGGHVSVDRLGAPRRFRCPVPAAPAREELSRRARAQAPGDSLPLRDAGAGGCRAAHAPCDRSAFPSTRFVAVRAPHPRICQRICQTLWQSQAGTRSRVMLRPACERMAVAEVPDGVLQPSVADDLGIAAREPGAEQRPTRPSRARPRAPSPTASARAPRSPRRAGRARARGSRRAGTDLPPIRSTPRSTGSSSAWGSTSTPYRR